jgi:hypothetical protein
VKPLGDVRSGVSDVTKYAPLLASYNQMAAKSCLASEERTDEALEEYQVALLMFGVDAMLVSTGAFYRPAFAGTRFVTNSASKVGLYRLRYLCGNRCWALGMSEIHVTLRGSMLTVTSNLARESLEMGVQLSRSDLEAVAEAHDVEVDRVVESGNISIDRSILENTSSEVENCSDQFVSKGEEAIEDADGGSGILDGIGGIEDHDTGEILEDSSEVIEDSKSAIENCRDR